MNFFLVLKLKKTIYYVLLLGYPRKYKSISKWKVYTIIINEIYLKKQFISILILVYIFLVKIETLRAALACKQDVTLRAAFNFFNQYPNQYENRRNIPQWLTRLTLRGNEALALHFQFNIDSHFPWRTWK
jgi:hypothetical protein